MGWARLHKAVSAGDAPKVLEFVQAGDDVNVTDGEGWTPLHLAARDGRLEIVRVLLDHRADANKANNDDWTPLHFATYMGHLTIVSALVDGGADTSKKDRFGNTATDNARSQGYAAILDLLIRHDTVKGGEAEKHKRGEEDAGEQKPDEAAMSAPAAAAPAVPSRMLDNVEQELGVIPKTSWVLSTRPSKSCLDDLKTNPHIRAAVHNIDGLVSDVQLKVMELRVTLKRTALAGLLEEDELAALVAYTHDNFVPEQRLRNLYFQLNKQLRQRKPDQRQVLKQVWGTFMHYAMSGLAKLQNWKGTLFRGMPDKQHVLAEYEQGRPIMWGAFSSASTDFAAAKAFAQPDGVVLQLRVSNARDIQQLSFFPAEGEVLLSPNLTLVVSGEPFQRDGCTVVPLVEVQGSTFVS